MFAETIHRLLPNGSRPSRRIEWEKCPLWPPDLFAVAATLVQKSGCYAHSRYTAGWKSSCLFGDSYTKDIVDAATKWQQALEPPTEVRHLWSYLPRGNRSAEDAAMRLMAIADETSAGVGFLPEDASPFADFLYIEHATRFLRSGKAIMPYLPSSLCIMVPTSEACVQPKSRTPEVGCTLRSLSHHLALLPPVGEVETRWLFGVPSYERADEPLNLLLVPFPYRIDGGSFVPESRRRSDISPTHGQNDYRFFLVRQKWIERDGRSLTGGKIAAFLLALIRSAEREVRQVHGVILPEGALSKRLAKQIAAILARRTRVQLFVSGILASGRGESGPQNCVFSSILFRKHILSFWTQSKHHRWRLTKDQICRYHMGDALDPRTLWWEQIDVNRRECVFYVFRRGASLATLVCEDLARIDPVQNVIRAVGPNLVVALLLDGPQLERRWPGRYATVLADDPGSAVLTLTSLGMVRRSVVPGEKEPRQIALWKEASGVARELSLPEGSHALLITVTQGEETKYALDGRSDNGTTVQLSLTGLHSIRVPHAPGWID